MAYIKIPIVLGVLIAVQACQKMVASEEEKPNIIFILTYDQRWDALGYAGNTIIQTPHMDQLARSGLYFQNAFVTTPICAVSKASLFTGLYERTHDYTFGKPPLHDRYMMQSYPYLLGKAGYRTGFVGKFGVKVNEGIVDSLFDSNLPTWYPYFAEMEGEQVHLADVNGNHAIDFIRSSKARPFCLSLSFWSPHAYDGEEQQYFWPACCDSLYRDVDIPIPETADPAFFEGLPEFLKTNMNRKRWYWRYDTPAKYQGKSLTSFYDSSPGKWRSGIFCEHRAENNDLLPKTECFRDDTRKFIRYEARPELMELYNHREDFHETRNLAYDSRFSDKIEYYRLKCDSAVSQLLTERLH